MLRIDSGGCFILPPRHKVTTLLISLIWPPYFICWVTFHFQKFQSAVIGEKLNLVSNNLDRQPNTSYILGPSSIFFNIYYLSDRCNLKFLKVKSNSTNKKTVALIILKKARLLNEPVPEGMGQITSLYEMNVAVTSVTFKVGWPVVACGNEKHVWELLKVT